jgi:hypothetical protein
VEIEEKEREFWGYTSENFLERKTIHFPRLPLPAAMAGAGGAVPPSQRLS